jgi:hypothetical protein
MFVLMQPAVILLPAEKLLPLLLTDGMKEITNVNLLPVAFIFLPMVNRLPRQRQTMRMQNVLPILQILAKPVELSSN